MGISEQRFWDSRTNTSRVAREGDPGYALFNAFVPHPIVDWNQRSTSARGNGWQTPQIAAANLPLTGHKAICQRNGC